MTHEFWDTLIETLEPLVPGISKRSPGGLVWISLFSALVFVAMLTFFYLYGHQHLKPRIPLPPATIFCVLMASLTSLSFLFVAAGFVSTQSLMSLKVGRSYLAFCRAETSDDTLFKGIGIAVVCWIVLALTFPFLFTI